MWLQPKSAGVRMERWGGDQLDSGRGIQRGGEVTVLQGAALVTRSGGGELCPSSDGRIRCLCPFILRAGVGEVVVPREPARGVMYTSCAGVGH